MNTNNDLLSRDQTYRYWVGGSLLVIVLLIGTIVRGFSYFQEINDKLNHLQSSFSVFSTDLNSRSEKTKPSVDVTNLLVLIKSLNQKITTLDKRLAQMARISNGIVTDNQPVTSQPVLPVTLSPPPLSKEHTKHVKPELMRNWMEVASSDSKEQVKMILQKHSQAARDRIAEETDKENLDRNILRQIMEDTQVNIDADMQAALPPEEYEALFDDRVN